MASNIETLLESRYDFSLHIAEIAYSIFKKYLDVEESLEFSNLMKHQNKRWVTDHLDTTNLTPNSSVNFDRFSKILTDMGNGELSVNRYPKQMHVQLGHYPNSELLCSEDEIPADIAQLSKMPFDELGVSLERLKSQRPIFRYLGDLYRISAQFDIFFTALERRLDDLPKESKRISDDIEDSIYMHPEFIKNELSYLLPFYIYSVKDEKDFAKICDSLLHLEITTKKHSSENQTITHPLVNYKGFSKVYRPENLLDIITESLTRFRTIRKPYKMLKFCYPLYTFIFGNFLEGKFLKDALDVFKRKNCTLITDKYSLDPLRNNLKFNNKKNRFMSDTSKEAVKAYLLNQLYSLKSCLEYMNSGRLMFFESYTTKSGKKVREGIISISYDQHLSTWLLIRYSDIFKISLMHHLEVSPPESKKLLDEIDNIKSLPKNFYTVLTFEKKVFLYYPTLEKEYNEIIKNQADSLFNEYKDLTVEDWLAISRQIKSLILYRKPYKFLNIFDWQHIMFLVENVFSQNPRYLRRVQSFDKHMSKKKRNKIIKIIKESSIKRYDLSYKEWRTVIDSAEKTFFNFSNQLVGEIHTIVDSFCKEIKLTPSYECDFEKLMHYAEIFNKKRK